MRTSFDIDDNTPEAVAWREQAIALFPNGGTAEERFACLHDIRVRDVVLWMLGDPRWALLTVSTVLCKVDPDYSLGRLVAQAISGGIPASEFVDTTQQLTRHQCLHGLAYAGQVSA